MPEAFDIKFLFGRNFVVRVGPEQSASLMACLRGHQSCYVRLEPSNNALRVGK